ncbi:Verru_Chthon cassette protein B [Verrucomicrobiota bacterium sgz303538]
MSHQFRRLKQAGFSLVEVTLAIGIIAFAFVALLGLIPTGLQVFRESIDSANEMWITQNLNSMIQVTPWSKIEDLEKYTFYFDEEGRLTDRTSPDDAESTDEEIALRRIYAVKLVFGKPERPGDNGAGTAGGGAYSSNMYQAVAVIAPYNKPAALKQLEDLNSVGDVRDIKVASGLKTRSFLVTRMDSMKD